MMKISFEKISPKGWEISMLIITTLIAAITGIAIYFRTISIEQQKVLFEQRQYAYKEFFEGSAKFWESKRLNDMAEKEADALTATDLRKDAE